MSGFKYRLIISMFCAWLQLSLHLEFLESFFSSIIEYSVCFIFRFKYHLIMNMFCVFYQDIILYLKDVFLFPGFHLAVVMVIVYKALFILPSVFKLCYSLNLERADFANQRFQYTCLKTYFHSLFGDCITTTLT